MKLWPFLLQRLTAPVPSLLLSTVMFSLDDTPFSDPSADIYVWSSDHVLFKLHTVILSLASDYFREMLAPARKSFLTQTVSQTHDDNEPPNETDIDGCPNYHLSERSDVLYPLFRLCYPVDDPPLETLTEVRSTLEVAKKYQMREALKITKRKLLAFAATEPMRVYAVACHLGLEDIASEAAKEVLKQKVQYSYVEELQDLPLGAYRRLLTFCDKSGHSSSRFVARPNRASLPTPPPSDFPASPLARAKSLSVYASRPAMSTFAFTPRTAPYPFNARDAEVVLSTSDNMQFRVYKSIIELASPVLASKLAGVPASSERRFSLPNPVRRLSLPESSQVVSALLKACYPTDEALPSDLHTLHLALLAAKDYQMPKAMRVLEDALTSRKDDTSAAPELLYALACRCDLRALGATAAKRTLRTSLLTESTFATFDKYGLTALDVQRLLAYHQRCRDAARYVAGPKWRTHLESSCRLGKWATDGRVPCWYERYMSGIAEDPWPTAATATNPELLRNAVAACEDAQPKGKGCQYCSDRAHLLVYYEFARYVGETIEALVDKVSPPSLLRSVHYAGKLIRSCDRSC